ncbi:hypothetical protein EVAR_87288_1 [Eumeta japonica]|uniref:Uncharacterized protein n=1 Tax=Eumeta variegata TaxID=151549 RepID=A0A4C1VXE5_EUMVA|nr:hypothetical protein EVAR_87288_1 [Eumeta japonica]
MLHSNVTERKDFNFLLTLDFAPHLICVPHTRQSISKASILTILIPDIGVLRRAHTHRVGAVCGTCMKTVPDLDKSQCPSDRRNDATIAVIININRISPFITEHAALKVNSDESVIKRGPIT